MGLSLINVNIPEIIGLCDRMEYFTPEERIVVFLLRICPLARFHLAFRALIQLVLKGVVGFDNWYSGSELSTLVASASFYGDTRIWDARMTGNEKPTLSAEANTKTRLSCLAGA